MTVIGEAYIRIKGENDIATSLKGATGSIDAVGAAGEKSSGRLRAAFGQVGHSLTAAFGPAFEPITEIMDKFEGLNLSTGKIKENVGKSFLAVGGAATVAGTMITTMSDKDKIAMRQLQNSVKNAGGNWDEYREKTEEVVKHQEHFGHDAVDTQKALTGLVTKTKDVKGSYENMQVVADLAAQKNISLSAAGAIVGKVMTGNTRTLKQFGISQDDVNKALDTGATKAKMVAQQTALDAVANDKAKIAILKTRDAHIQELISTTKNKDEQGKLRDELAKDREARSKLSDNMAQNKSKAADLKKEIKDLTTGTHAGDAATKLLADKLKGQASAAADTFTGKMKAAKARIEDFVGEVGQKVGPALQVAGPAMMGLGAVIESGIIGKIGKGITKIKEFNVLQKVTGAATRVWTGIQAAFNLVMEANPIFLMVAAIVALVAILVIAYIKFKPFRDIVNEIGKTIGRVFVAGIHLAMKLFGDFVKFFEDVWKSISDILKKYGLIILAVIAPFIGIPLLIIRHWNVIVKFFTNLWHSISAVFTRIVSSVISSIADMWTKGVAKVKGFIADVLAFFRQLPGRVVSALATFGSTIANALSNGLRNIKSSVTGAFAGAASWLLSAGRNIVSGLVSGLGNVWRTISGKFTSIKNDVIGALAGAGSWLIDAGRNIISGLISGIGSAITSGLKSAVQGIASKIKSWKGPEDYDKALLIPAGGNIIGGLIGGIEKQLPNLKKSLNNVTKTISTTDLGTIGVGAGASAAGTGIGGGRVYNLFPNAIINMGDTDANQLVQSLQTAMMASRL
jgi:phage-related protein